MALSDAIQGAKRPSQLITWTDEDGVPADLTGATITARITRSGVTTASDGAFVLTSAATGVFRWDYGTTDVTTAGKFTVQFTATFASGTTPARTMAHQWTVQASI